MRQPLESDKQTSLWPLALLGILGVISWVRSKSLTRTQHTEESIRKQPHTQPQSYEPHPAGELKRISAEIDFSPKEAQRYYAEQSEAYRLQRRSFWVGLATLGALTIYTVYTACIYYSGQKTTKLAYRPRINLISLNSALRVSTINGQLRVDLKDGKFFQVEVPIKNTGPLPATNVIISRFDAVIGDKENAKRLPYQEFRETEHVIPPASQGVNFDIVIPGTEDISSRIEELKKGKTWLEFSVLIVYDDEFGDTHHTEFCHLFTINGPTDICPWPVQND